MAPRWWEEHGKKIAAGAVGFLLLLPLVNGAVGGGESFFVTVKAPQADDGITVWAGKDPGLIGSCPDEARAEISKDGQVVYPNVFGRMDVEDCQGSIDVPYHKFAHENGDYQLLVSMDSDTAETRFLVEKVVNWVYIRSFPNASEERTRVEVALARTQAQPIQSAVFTSGELVLNVYWEECSEEGPVDDGLGILEQTRDCRADHDHVLGERIPLNTTAVTNVIIPWGSLESPKFDDSGPNEGWYNVTATFHNEEAKANKNVPMDPTVFNEDPSGNWFEVDYE